MRITQQHCGACEWKSTAVVVAALLLGAVVVPCVYLCFLFRALVLGTSMDPDMRLGYLIRDYLKEVVLGEKT